jgi:hypothetical protein
LLGWLFYHPNWRGVELVSPDAEIILFAIKIHATAGAGRDAGAPIRVPTRLPGFQFGAPASSRHRFQLIFEDLKMAAAKDGGAPSVDL